MWTCRNLIRPQITIHFGTRISFNGKLLSIGETLVSSFLTHMFNCPCSKQILRKIISSLLKYILHSVLCGAWFSAVGLLQNWTNKRKWVNNKTRNHLSSKKVLLTQRFMTQLHYHKRVQKLVWTLFWFKFSKIPYQLMCFQNTYERARGNTI